MNLLVQKLQTGKKEYLSKEYYESLTRFMAMDIFQEYSGDDGYIATLNSLKSKANIDEADVKTIFSIQNNVSAHKRDYPNSKSLKQHIESVAKNYPIQSPQENISTTGRTAGQSESKEMIKKNLVSMVNNFKQRLPLQIYSKFIKLHMRWKIKSGTAINGGTFIYDLLQSDVDIFISALEGFASEDPQGGGGDPPTGPSVGIIAQLSNMLSWFCSKKNALATVDEGDAGELEDTTVRRRFVHPYINTGNELESYAGLMVNILEGINKPEPVSREQVLKAFARGGGVEREIHDLGDVVYSFLNNMYLSKVIYFLENIDSIDNWDFEYVELFTHILREFLKEDESAAQRTYLFYTLLADFDYSSLDHPRASGLELVARHFMLRSQDKLFGDAPNFTGTKYPVKGILARALESVAAAESRPFTERRDKLIDYLISQMEEIQIEEVEEAENLPVKKVVDAVANNNPMAPRKQRRSRRRRSKAVSATRKISFNEPTALVEA